MKKLHNGNDEVPDVHCETETRGFVVGAPGSGRGKFCPVCDKSWYYGAVYELEERDVY